MVQWQLCGDRRQDRRAASRASKATPLCTGCRPPRFGSSLGSNGVQVEWCATAALAGDGGVRCQSDVGLHSTTGQSDGHFGPSSPVGEGVCNGGESAARCQPRRRTNDVASGRMAVDGMVASLWTVDGGVRCQSDVALHGTAVNAAVGLDHPCGGWNRCATAVTKGNVALHRTADVADGRSEASALC